MFVMILVKLFDSYLTLGAKTQTRCHAWPRVDETAFTNISTQQQHVSLNQG